MALFGPFLAILSAIRKRLAIKRLGLLLEWTMLPLLAMMLSMELVNAMPIGGHWQMRRENDSAFDIYGSTHGMESMDSGHNNRKKRSAVRFGKCVLHMSLSK